MSANIQYKFSSKQNKRPLKAVCAKCLEDTVFRIVTVDGTNQVSCVRCLKYVKYNKKFKVAQHPIVKHTHLDARDKFRRMFFRVARWFKGDHIYKPFGRKRKKAEW